MVARHYSKAKKLEADKTPRPLRYQPFPAINRLNEFDLKNESLRIDIPNRLLKNKYAYFNGRIINRTLPQQPAQTAREIALTKIKAILEGQSEVTDFDTAKLSELAKARDIHNFIQQPSIDRQINAANANAQATNDLLTQQLQRMDALTTQLTPFITQMSNVINNANLDTVIYNAVSRSLVPTNNLINQQTLNFGRKLDNINVAINDSPYYQGLAKLSMENTLPDLKPATIEYLKGYSEYKKILFNINKVILLHYRIEQGNLDRTGPDYIRYRQEMNELYRKNNDLIKTMTDKIRVDFNNKLKEIKQSGQSVNQEVFDQLKLYEDLIDALPEGDNRNFEDILKQIEAINDQSANVNIPSRADKPEQENELAKIAQIMETIVDLPQEIIEEYNELSALLNDRDTTDFGIIKIRINRLKDELGKLPKTTKLSEIMKRLDRIEKNTETLMSNNEKINEQLISIQNKLDQPPQVPEELREQLDGIFRAIAVSLSQEQSIMQKLNENQLDNREGFQQVIQRVNELTDRLVNEIIANQTVIKAQNTNINAFVENISAVLLDLNDRLDKQLEINKSEIDLIISNLEKQLEDIKKDTTEESDTSEESDTPIEAIAEPIESLGSVNNILIAKQKANDLSSTSSNIQPFLNRFSNSKRSDTVTLLEQLAAKDANENFNNIFAQYSLRQITKNSDLTSKSKKLESLTMGVLNAARTEGRLFLYDNDKNVYSVVKDITTDNVTSWATNKTITFKSTKNSDRYKWYYMEKNNDGISYNDVYDRVLFNDKSARAFMRFLLKEDEKED